MRYFIRFMISMCYVIVACTVNAQNRPANNSTQPVLPSQPFPAAYLSGLVNYIRTWEPNVPVKSIADIASADIKSSKESTQYFDGLGRPIQTIDRALGAKQQDIVNMMIYDGLGREQYKYLPYVSSESNGKFKKNPFAEQAAFLGNQYGPIEKIFYRETEIEGSPLNRELKVYNPGNSWARIGGNKPITTSFLSNTVADHVIIWDISQGASIPVKTGEYQPGQLFKQVIVDEDGKSTIEYRNKANQLILKKKQVAKNPNDIYTYVGWLCTFNIYDDLGNLRMVLPPKAVEWLINNNWQLNATIIADLCFQYKYDDRKRLIEKYVPGMTGASELVYDLRNRLVFTRTPNMKVNGQWLTNFYDGLDRQVMTALYNSSESRNTLQNTMNNTTSTTTEIEQKIKPVADLVINKYDGRVLYEAANSVDVNQGFDSGDGNEIEIKINPNGEGNVITLIVTNPLPSLDKTKLYPLSYTFYDNYEYNGAYAFRGQDFTKLTAEGPADEFTNRSSIMTNSLVTGTKVRILNTEQWLTTTTYYDDKNRVLQSISDHVNGNQEVESNMYNFSGKIRKSYLTHNNAKSNQTPDTRVLTIIDYDHAARIVQVRKQLNDDPLKVTVQTEYNDQGELSKKILGNNLESLEYTYNIRGWLKGINKEYAKSGGSHFFGTELHYDYGYNNNFMNGSVAGLTWRSAGDNKYRSYGYTYDAANRLLKADFSQFYDVWDNRTDANFDVIVGDGTNPEPAYDANGNIKALKHYGIDGAQSRLIDDLKYTYQNNNMSNRLQGVVDEIDNKNSTLGDFKEIEGKGNDDYTYDDNGSMIRDANKGIALNAISYNHLGLPEKAVIKDKGTIFYLYDANGSKLRKTVVDNTGGSTKTTLTDYIGGFVYKNDTLQQLHHEEGRIRWVAKNNQPGTFAFDYFVKDHLGNIRIVLTEQTDFSMYRATMEAANASKENALFSNIEETRNPKPVGYPSSQQTSTNEYVAKLSGKADGKKVGPSIVLKVMSGDTISINAEAFYKSQGPSNNQQDAPIEDIVADLARAFNTAFQGITGHASSADQTQNPFTNSFYSNDYQRLKQKENTQANIQRPKAYLNFVLFDEQFKLVDESSGVRQVRNEPDQLQTLSRDKMIMSKSGYLYVYTSNESPQDVYFDNVVVGMGAGSILEETHYYPFGLTMAGISNIAIKGGRYFENKEKFNGKKLESKEFEDGSGLEWYDYGNREYDPQVGRFFRVDPLANDFPQLTPYQYAGNDPIRNIDLDGLEPQTAVESWNLKTAKSHTYKNGQKAFLIDGYWVNMQSGSYNMVHQYYDRKASKWKEFPPVTEMENNAKMAQALYETADVLGKGYASMLVTGTTAVLGGFGIQGLTAKGLGGGLADVAAQVTMSSEQGFVNKLKDVNLTGVLAGTFMKNPFGAAMAGNALDFRLNGYWENSIFDFDGKSTKTKTMQALTWETILGGAAGKYVDAGMSHLGLGNISLSRELVKKGVGKTGVYGLHITTTGMTAYQFNLLNTIILDMLKYEQNTQSAN
ncbi:RHS repeat-associated core domain-containing protein [Chitinophaga pendula]|uniref:DUF6443 domain-containing protein n=1 Tax=Chitinophaga TaxID=79328 RepID=UPI000BAEAD79|nr:MULTISPECIES: DUF6443 domain-containing protein [Chitinophaga]ASZ13081.1 hypothetical protein CK934_20010 [Chitinophaga sp. MD30]UCJ09298.1 RHS repeat-associated core domain-containing protein [Chitinophaga pendula]